MKHTRYFVVYAMLLLIAAACGALIVTPLRQPPRFEEFCIGVLLGTAFGQTSLAASWVALGPGPLLIRLPLSVLWVVMLLGATFLGVLSNDAPNVSPGEIVSIVGQTVGLQWLVSLVPLCSLAAFFRLRLRHWTDVPHGGSARRQFGIGQLMIFTALIALLLGLGRALLSSNWFRLAIDRELPIFLFLVGCTVVMTMPLLFAAFLSRRSVLAILGSLLFIVLVSVAEMPLLNATIGTVGGPNVMHVVWINLFAAAWVLAAVLVVRVCGYQFAAPGEAPFAAEK